VKVGAPEDRARADVDIAMGSTVRVLLVLVIADQRGISMARALPEATLANMKQNL
jgi:hypothetical protein